MDKKGAVPIPYIIALVLGIVVIGIIGYWFFVSGGKLGEEIDITQCRTNAVNYCNTWKLEGYAEISGEPAVVGWFVRRYTNCDKFTSQLNFNSDAKITANEATTADEEYACILLIGS